MLYDRAGMPNRHTSSCPSDDIIDAYCIGRLCQEEIRLLEEHALHCVTCASRAVLTLEFVEAIRSSALRVQTGTALAE